MLSIAYEALKRTLRCPYEALLKQVHRRRRHARYAGADRDLRLGQIECRVQARQGRGARLLALRDPLRGHGPEPEHEDRDLRLLPTVAAEVFAAHHRLAPDHVLFP